MSEPLISVVIPAHNAEKYLEETLASVHTQTFSDYEIIVVDDGSTDRTAEIASDHDRVVLLAQTNRGEAGARNTGIRAARGKYVAFLDADDIWLPSKLEKQAARLLAHPSTAWTYTDALVFDSATRRTICRIGERIHLHEGDILRLLLLRNFIPSATPVVKRTALMEAGLFDEAGERRMGVDWDMWLRIAERHTVSLIDQPLAMIRMHASNISQAWDPFEAYRNKRAILEDAIARNPRAAAGVRSRARVNIAVWAGTRCLRNALRKCRPGGGR
jgi:glycosyltransferase involved in cell wall biosynthesis